MAAVTFGIATASTTDNAALTTASFTPAAGDLLVAAAVVSGQGGGGTFSDSQTLGWTTLATALKNTSADSLVVAVSNLFAAASSMTVTFTPAGSPTATGVGIVVIRVSGMSRKGVSAIRQSVKEDNNGTNTTPTPTFASAVLTENPVFTVVANGSSPPNLTVPTSFTQQNNSGYITPTNGLESASIDSGFTGTSLPWSNSSSVNCDVAIELDTSALSEFLSHRFLCRKEVD